MDRPVDKIIEELIGGYKGLGGHYKFLVLHADDEKVARPCSAGWKTANH